jgi:hypothetical protein
MSQEEIALAAAKAGSIVLGAALGLVFMPPVSIRDAFRRLAFSIIAGWLFSDLMGDFLVGFLKLSSAAENPAVATALTAALSWWIFGAVVRVLGIWTPKK